MDSYQDSSLTALTVFQNTINRELIRSLHVYRLKDGEEKEVEREFLLSADGPYFEIAADPILILRRLRVIELFEVAFHANRPPCLSHSPSFLYFYRNPNLKSIPTLASHFHFIFKLCPSSEDDELPQLSSRECEGDRDDDQHPRRSLPVLDQDLNCLPYPVPVSEASQSEDFGKSTIGVIAKTKKRAATEDIARIALEDLVKYFGLPIVEASRNLKVGLTVLKRKCREFGIPRWPHRKIKSLDSLIRNLQEEAERQNQENEDAAMAVAKRRRMLEREKETIERKPFIEIQSETKRFRQDVFKRRHRARALRSQGLCLSSLEN